MGSKILPSVDNQEVLTPDERRKKTPLKYRGKKEKYPKTEIPEHFPEHLPLFCLPFQT